MENYQPSKRPVAREWLELDETERILFVKDYHVESDVDLPEDALQLHAAIHVIVENQIAMKHEPVPVTVDRLIRQGLDRHEAIHAIGAILSEDIYDLLNDEKASFDLQKYRRRLSKLTAKRWLKGKW